MLSSIMCYVTIDVLMHKCFIATNTWNNSLECKERQLNLLTQKYEQLNLILYTIYCIQIVILFGTIVFACAYNV